MSAEKLDTKLEEQPEQSVETSADAHVDQNFPIDSTIEAIDSLNPELLAESTAEDNQGGATGSQQTTSTTGDDDQAQKSKLAAKPLPEPRIMIRKIQSRLNRNVNQLLKQAKGKMSRNISKGMAYDLNETVGKVRKLRSTLYKLATATFDYVKALYVQLFKPKGVNVSTT